MISIGDKVKCIIELENWDCSDDAGQDITYPEYGQILTVRDIIDEEDGERYLRFNEIKNPPDIVDNEEPQFRLKFDTFEKIEVRKKSYF